MNRESTIKQLVHDFECKAHNLPDSTLELLEAGKLVIQLARPVDGEAGGKKDPGVQVARQRVKP
ncbi:hypothetical protein Lgee_0680 [Legionella geestiana]|uniref:Uncharacterized protein n=1 Tax=Legionella geestiana TaxID=45065 RepID=A0A0W0U3K4_9GAMM|nr:hypothetical protein [Legionella geestiana]KTD02351.1 hypothetical protein Lgee_0680 [Legionella geestiana]QBS12174.1 hypothetical protein E4T54_05125 [Legionella geestiana]QDQ40112.1 hypothetical protein E3226_006715 [Legionella geestiana]STX53097.1 Uncharacterised protein [Legionella geestiana]